MPASRREIFAAGAAAGIGVFATRAGAASFGNPDEPPQGIVNTQGNPRGAVDPGPQNPRSRGSSRRPSRRPRPMSATFRCSGPRSTMHRGASRTAAGPVRSPRRTSRSPLPFPASTCASTRGGIRELHWHQAAEWGFVTYGNCRVTVLDPEGRAYVADVTEGDLWYFPVGYPHSLQGLGPDGVRVHPRLRQRQSNRSSIPCW